MPIPRPLGYAMLAGLAPVVGLRASILPLAAHAILGTSRSLAAGPVAAASLPTASAVGAAVEPGSARWLAAATALAPLVGPMLLAMGSCAPASSPTCRRTR